MSCNTTSRFDAACSLTTSLAFLLILLFSFSNEAQTMKTDPGHKQNVMLGDVRFSCPNGYNVQQEHTSNGIGFMRHGEYDLGLFVTVLGKSVNADYIKELSMAVSSYLFPNGKTKYSWKRIDGYHKVSKYEINGGGVQGFNGQRRVCVQYRQLKVQGTEIIVGYVFELGGGELARLLFERNLAGDSMPGWYAQAHIIASITGEKYEEINPYGGFTAAPPPPKKER